MAFAVYRIVPNKKNNMVYDKLSTIILSSTGNGTGTAWVHIYKIKYNYIKIHQYK